MFITGIHKTRSSWILLLVLLFSACTPSATPPPNREIATVIKTVEVTREVTVEVTRMVDVPVTSTPTPTLYQTATLTLTPTKTRIPSATPTWTPPKVSVLEHSACLYGPGTAYLYKYGLGATAWMWVIGRNSEGTWLFVKGYDVPDSNGCWIQTSKVKFLLGDVRDVPVYWMGMPGSVLYQPPRDVSANRVGDEVTIFWMPVWMTEDDYRGYLIEAWVCQGGKIVFLPIKYETSVYDNSTMIAVKVIDEQGCSLPSNARIYTVEKHGYTGYRMIPWPPHPTSGTPTSTPTPTPIR